MVKENNYKTFVLLLLIAVLLIGELAILYLHPNTHTNKKMYYVEGISEFTLSSYKSVIKLPKISHDELNLVSNCVSNEMDLENQTVLFLKNESCIFDVYSTLHKGISKANFIASSPLYVNGSSIINNSVNFQYDLNPTLPVGSKLRFKFIGLVENGVVTRGVKFTLMGEKRTIPLRISKIKKISSYYIYYVDFVNRTCLRDVPNAHISNVIRNTNNKKEDYVEYVGDNYIVVNENYTNKSRIIEDYGENVIFEPSYVISNTTMNLSCASTYSLVSIYQYKIDDPNYVVPIDKQFITLNESNTTRIYANVFLSGNTIMEIYSFKP